VLCDAAAAIALPSLLQLVLPMVFMLVPVMVLLLVFVMMLLPSLPLLLPNHCRCSRLRAQGFTDRQHITALIRLCNAFAIPLRRLRDCSATSPRSLRRDARRRLLPYLATNHCRCSRPWTQGVIDRHHTALQHAREASAMPLRTRLQLLSD
jgi:hypothetical protein